ncbi:MAG: saccharopine dehydrogenase C-terminal domain-containing protein [Ginsengibacter sp.]
MKKILIFGAGKSASCLIDYLCRQCEENNWMLVVCDSDLLLAQSKISNCKNANAISIDVSDDVKRTNMIRDADIVISMLPHHLHFLVAFDCVDNGKHLLTASYIDEKIKQLGDQINQKKLLFLCEMGLDPGIDHMSAMHMINDIKNNGGTIESFKSHCGGLISPESDNNPWHYKITWNPGNIVMAGAAGAVYKIDGQIKEVAYTDIFRDCKTVVIPGLSNFAWYPNRDSLAYINTYGLNDIKTFIRTTLRHPSFCHGWNNIVNMELTATNDYEQIKSCKTYGDWYQKKIASTQFIIGENQNEFIEQLDYLGLRDNTIIATSAKNSAYVLQNRLEKKLAMHPHDKDMIVMLHEVVYEIKGKKKEIRSCLIVTGEDEKQTAMAKTVGLPLGIAAKLILLDKMKLTGLHIPVIPEIYEPVLSELETNGIQFKNEIKEHEEHL